MLVAAAIGSLITLFLTEGFLASDAARQTINGGDDALTNGAIALHLLERDIVASGLGVMTVDILGCSLTLRDGITLPALVAVGINSANIPAGDANTDTLLLVEGSDDGPPEGAFIQAQPSLKTYLTDSANSFRCNDQIIAARRNRPSPCELRLDTVVRTPASDGSCTNSGAGSKEIGVQIGSLDVPPYGRLHNLGAAPRVQVYAIRNGNLTVCNFMVANCGSADLKDDASVWVPIANNIVSLRAQYGRDDTAPAADGVVDTYGQAQTPGATGVCIWARILGVRIVLTARNPQYEKATGSGVNTRYVTESAPTWAGSTAGNPQGSTSNPIDLSQNTDWRNYRYRAFEVVIPLRNSLMLGDAGC